MNDFKVKEDWNYALRHVPRRKVVDFNIENNLGRKSELSYDKSSSRTRWIPSTKVDFENLKFNPQKKESNEEKRRRITLKSILND